MIIEVTPQGIALKTQPEIEEELKALLRSALGPSLDFATETFEGQIVKLVAERLSAFGEVLQLLPTLLNPYNSFGTYLTGIALLTGTTRRGATYTTVLARVNVDAGVYAIGELVAYVEDQPDKRFFNSEEIDNTLGPTQNFDVVFRAENIGAIEVLANTLNTIAVPVDGWNSINNLEDGSTGLEIETDAELAERRDQELALGGSSTVPAIAADLRNNLALGITSVRVLENDLDIEVNGMPPHSIEAIVQGPDPSTPEDDQAIADQIAKSMGHGIRAFGNIEKEHVDSEGNIFIIGFSRPEDVDIQIEVEILVDVGTFIGEVALNQLIRSLINSQYGPGDTVRFFDVACIIKEAIGVIDIVDLKISKVGDPLGVANIPIDLREAAKIEADDIDITIS